MSDHPAIRVRNLVKRFGAQTVLDGVNLEVQPGEILVIMGGSGSGKSTLLRCMIRSICPEEGEVYIFGDPIGNLAERHLNRVRRKFGVLFQSGALFNSMTLAENVALPISEHTDLSREIIDIQVKIKLELVGLREHADKYPAQISGGMKKRGGLARALALDPQILFYDEPSAGLDPVTSAGIDRLIIDMAKKLGVTSVVVTHEMDSAFAIADRMAMLDKGRMICIEDRSWYEHLRDASDEEADSFTEEEQLVRQFVRGAAEGPLTKRKQESNYEEDLLGHDVTPAIPAMPSVETTRRVPRR
jgi:phospholipid/cholesterol/gamma-HCH transport system ATP-binding protein